MKDQHGMADVVVDGLRLVVPPLIAASHRYVTIVGIAATGSDGHQVVIPFGYRSEGAVDAYYPRRQATALRNIWTPGVGPWGMAEWPARLRASAWRVQSGWLVQWL
jgi:hypothetical protein